MTESARIAELRRRVERDPASIAFAQLAEEYRREGDYEQAVQVCRAGLAQYPEYLSARVTLGRALTEMGRFDQAWAELQHVLGIAPDNLAAKRALADLHHRGGPGPATGPAAGAAPSGSADAPGPSSARSPEDERAIARLEALLRAILEDRAERASAASRRSGPASPRPDATA
jgi:tetratricopeptide (TPR) repeat protein